jgi:hypothetical protein
MVEIKRFILAILIVMACLPTIICYTPVHAYTMANNTATSSFCVRQDPITGAWSQSMMDYVGCVNSANDTRYGIGIRFSAVNITQGATITSAYLVITSNGTYTQHTVSSIIQGEDTNSAAAIIGVVNYRSRTRTSSAVLWDGIPVWVFGTEYASGDISTIIQEIIDRPGWVIGNNVVLFWNDHDARSSQSTYMPPIVRGGSSYKLVVNYTSTPGVTVPDITTKEASNIGSTTAILNAFINGDGDDPNNVSVRFGYDTITHAANFALYSTIGTWSTSNYSSGELASDVLTGLTPATTYFFNVQGQNSAGTTTGTEYQFVTGTAVTTLSPSNFVIIPLSTSTSLQWTKPAGFSESRLYYKSGSIPSSNTTGTLLYSGINDYYPHSGLTSGTTYGYLVYGYENGTWSSPAFGSITTKGEAATTGLPVPPQPANWFLDTDYTTQNKTFFYPIVNNIADTLSMPRNTAWMTWALGVAMFLGFLVWSASRSMVALTVAVVVGVALGTAQHLIPLVYTLLVLVFGISIIAVRERV